MITTAPSFDKRVYGLRRTGRRRRGPTHEMEEVCSWPWLGRATILTGTFISGVFRLPLAHDGACRQDGVSLDGCWMRVSACRSPARSAARAVCMQAMRPSSTPEAAPRRRDERTTAERWLLTRHSQSWRRAHHRSRPLQACVGGVARGKRSMRRRRTALARGTWLNGREQGELPCFDGRLSSSSWP